MNLNDVPTVRIESPAVAGANVQIEELEGIEAIGKLFDFRIELVCNDPGGLDEERLLSEPAELVFSRNGQDLRRVFGAVSSVKDRLHSEGATLAYTLRFVPRVFAMSLNRMSQVFVDTTVPDILKKKLEDAGFAAGKDFELRLLGQYPPRELVIQYEETDLDFVSRLAEHLGISLFFEHRDERDVLVFGDANSAFKTIDGDPTVGFYPRGDAIGVFALEATTRTIPGKVVLKDYNYRTPQVELVSETSVSGAGKGAVVEYGAHFKTKDEGDHMAQVRAEELRAMRRVFEGRSDVQTLRAGAKLTLDGHPKANEELLLVEVRHHARQVVFGTGREEGRAYTNELRAIPAATPFRPPRLAPKPKVHGAISGVIEAAQAGKYAELDQHGRYHVRLMLDQGGAPKGGASSLLRMAQPHAGPGYGFHFPLRDGVEVMLACIDGDPDRLIITGAVPNPTTPSTVGDKNGMRNVIRTGGGTEINIDDNEGGTRFKVSTPCQNTVFQLGAPNAPVLGIFMGTDKDATMKAGDTIRQEAGVKIDVVAGVNLNEEAPFIDIHGKTRINAHAPDVLVFGEASTTVQAGTKVLVGAPQIEVGGGAKIEAHAPEVDVGGDAKIAAHAPLIEILAGGMLNASAQGTALLRAGGAVVVKGASVLVDGGVVTITADGVVTVKASMVNVEGSGIVNVKGGIIKLN